MTCLRGGPFTDSSRLFLRLHTSISKMALLTQARSLALSQLAKLLFPATLVATSLLATFRGFAGSFGTAIGGGAFGRALSARLAEGFARLDGGVHIARPVVVRHPRVPDLSGVERLGDQVATRVAEVSGAPEKNGEGKKSS